MFEKLSKCPYCSANIKVSAEDVFVVCEYCGREMEVPRFTQEEKRLTQAVEEMRASTEAAEAALKEAMERAEESDAQMEERIAALAEQQAEDSVQARMHRDELLSELRANAIEQREAAKAHLHELKSEQHRLSDQLDGLRREQQAGKAASLQHCYALGESAQSAGRFDEAIEHFQKLLVMSEDHEAEVHWRIVMCRYGVEYVREQSSETWLPTITHMIVDSIEDDADYLAAERYARSDRMRSYYRDEARRIDDILDKYREVYGQEKPYDVFISVKQGDEKGRPTEDSMVAMDLYYMLTGMGLHVFNSRISLQEHAGLEYEPYIMAALMTSKAMLVVGTRSDYMNSPWVRNEWRRYRWLQENGKETRRLIAYIVGMRTSEIPKEMGALQIINAQTSGDPKGNLRRIVEKDFGNRGSRKNDSRDDEKKRLRRAELFLEEGSVDKCEEYLEMVLEDNPEEGMAYALKLCIAKGVNRIDKLGRLTAPIADDLNFRRAMSFGDEKLQKKLTELNESVQANIRAEAEEKARREQEEAGRKERERRERTLREKMDAERIAREQREKEEAERREREAAEKKARDEREAREREEQRKRELEEIRRREAGEAERRLLEERKQRERAEKEQQERAAAEKAQREREFRESIEKDRQKNRKGKKRILTVVAGLVVVLGMLAVFRVPILDGLAMNGSPRQMMDRAFAYDSGTLLAYQSNDKAIEWYKRAVDAGSGEAAAWLGCYYADGSHGLAQDMLTATNYLVRAAEQGENITWVVRTRIDDFEAAAESVSEIACNVARIYQNGWGVGQDLDKAAQWYTKADILNAEEAAAQAAAQAAEADSAGVVSQALAADAAGEYDQAINLLKAQGKAEDLFTLGDLHYMEAESLSGEAQREEYFIALSYLSAAEELDHPKAISFMGSFYLNGWGVAQDNSRAYELYLRAADLNYSNAMVNVGYMLGEGLAPEGDPSECIEWYEKASDLGNGTASYNLSVLYYDGRYVQQSYEEAARYLQLTMTRYDTLEDPMQGVPQGNLGYMYLHGEGVEADVDEAFRLCTEAVELGNYYACYELGSIYLDYEEYRNFEKAYENFELGARYGDQAECAYMAGHMLEGGDLGTEDFELAFRYYAFSARLGYEEAIVACEERNIDYSDTNAYPSPI